MIFSCETFNEIAFFHMYNYYKEDMFTGTKVINVPFCTFFASCLFKYNKMKWAFTDSDFIKP